MPRRREPPVGAKCCREQLQQILSNSIGHKLTEWQEWAGHIAGAEHPGKQP
jgi:hypothetical protein